jgi:hypothetical protein
MHREYLSRVAVVSLCMLSAAVMLGVAALFPAEIRARLADRASVEAADRASKAAESADLASAEADIGTSKDILIAFSTDDHNSKFSDAVIAISAGHSPISISSMVLNRQGTSTLAITIDGVAQTRSDLLAWKGRLEALAPGATVELPISTLAKSKDVNFSLRLTANLK